MEDEVEIQNDNDDGGPLPHAPAVPCATVLSFLLELVAVGRKRRSAMRGGTQ